MSTLLILHGTNAITLSPTVIAQAAEADMRRKERNAKIKSARATAHKERRAAPPDVTEPYAFYPAHVAEAKDALELLNLAPQKREEVMVKVAMWETECSITPDGATTPKCPIPSPTIRLYHNADGLLAAAEIVKAHTDVI